nr:unnamed protein product [Callosobruchus analis]
MGPPKRGGSSKSEGKAKRRKKDEEEWTYDEDDTNDVDESGEADIPGAAARNAEKNDQGVQEDEFGAKDYRSQMTLKADNASRPLWSIPRCVTKLLKDPVIQECRLRRNVENESEELITQVQDKKNVVTFGAKPTTSTESQGDGTTIVPDDITNFYEKMDNEEDEEEASLQTVSFEVNQEKIEVLQKRCIELEHPLLAEYDLEMILSTLI